MKVGKLLSDTALWLIGTCNFCVWIINKWMIIFPVCGLRPHKFYMLPKQIYTIIVAVYDQSFPPNLSKAK